MILVSRKPIMSIDKLSIDDKIYAKACAVISVTLLALKLNANCFKLFYFLIPSKTFRAHISVTLL